MERLRRTREKVHMEQLRFAIEKPDIDQLRYATEADVRLISTIYTKSWRAAYQGIVPQEFLDVMSEGVMAEALFRQMREERLTTQIVYNERGKAVGSIGYGQAREDGLPDWGEIFSVYLLPEYFGKGGYAQTLMQAALSTFALCRYKNVMLWVFRENARARRFYEKQGFAWDGGERTLMFCDTPVEEMRYTIQL